mgnify:FL=1
MMKYSSTGMLLFSFLLMVPQCDLWQRISGPEETASVEVVMDRTRFAATDSVRVTVLNRSNQPIYLEGCSPFYLNTVVDGRWVAHAMRMCYWEGIAVKVEPGRRYSETFRPGVYFVPGAYRFSATVYTDCVDEQPISQAECRARETVLGPVFTVAQ